MKYDLRPMTAPTVNPEVREVGQRPFGIYAIIALFLMFVATAALDIIRLRVGFASELLQQIAELLHEGSGLSTLPQLLFRDTNILVLINVVIITVIVATIVGLWFRFRQAWVAAMLLVGIGLVYNIWSYLEGTPLYLNMLIHVIAVFYLNERGVRLAFDPPRPREESMGGLWL